MTLYDVIKKYGANKGTDTMWDSVKKVSDYLEEHEDELDEYDEMLKEVYASMCGKHYNEELGREQIESMYYEDSNGNRQYAPYWTENDMHQAYQAMQRLIPSCYTEWDFYVVINMIASDYHNLLESWFPGQSKDKAIEMAIHYLNDPDHPCKDCKIWCHFN